MSSSEDSSSSDNSIQGKELLGLVSAAALLIKLKYLLENQSVLVNPPCPIPKLTGAQWMQLTLSNPTSCHDNFRMSRDAFMELHDMLRPFGLPSTNKCDSIEALGIYVWTCAHHSAARQCKYRFERSLDTVSRKVTKIANVMFKWAQTILVPPDKHYGGVSLRLQKYAPWFDGCIGAVDGTHIEVEVNHGAKADFFNRNKETSINVCAIVNMDGHFTWIGAGKAGACHDQAVLEDCQSHERFPHPPQGRYYLGDSGYTFQDGYMTPYRHTRYHEDEFRGVDLTTLTREEKFNLIHSKLRNIIERRFGVLKERWQILEKVPYCAREKQAWIIVSCFALDNFLWRRTHGQHPPTYPMSDWVEANRGTTINVLREWISTVMWSVTLAE